MGNSVCSSGSDDEINNEGKEDDTSSDVELDSDKDAFVNLDLSHLFDPALLRNAAAKVKDELPENLLQQQSATILRWLEEHQQRNQETVTLAQFYDLLVNRSVTREDCARAFTQFDSEGDGTADISSMLDVLRSSTAASLSADLGHVVRSLQACSLTPGLMDVYSSENTSASQHGSRLLSFILRNRAPSSALPFPILNGFNNTTSMRLCVLQAHLTKLGQSVALRHAEESLAASGEELKSITKCYSSLEVSSNKNEAHRLTDGDASTHWQSDGSARTHWIRLRMRSGVLIKQLSIGVSAGDQSYMPQLVTVAVGKTTTSLTEIKEVRIPSHVTGDVILLENTQTFYPLIQISVKRCQSDGCDTRIHNLKTLGCRVQKEQGVSVQDASVTWYLQVLASVTKATLPLSPGLRDVIVTQSLTALSSMGPLSLCAASSERPGFLTPHVLSQMDHFIADMAVCPEEPLSERGLRVLLGFSLAHGSVSGVLRALCLLQTHPQHRLHCTPILHSLTAACTAFWRKQGQLLQMNVFACDGGQKEDTSGPRNVLNSNWTMAQPYLSGDGRIKVAMIFTPVANDLCQITKLRIKVDKGARGPRRGLVFVYRHLPSNAPSSSLQSTPTSPATTTTGTAGNWTPEAHLRLLSRYDAWSASDVAKCQRERESCGQSVAQHAPVAHFTLENEWDEVEVPLSGCPVGRYVCVKFLEPRQSTAERIGVVGVRFYGFLRKAVFADHAALEMFAPIPETGSIANTGNGSSTTGNGPNSGGATVGIGLTFGSGFSGMLGPGSPQGSETAGEGVAVEAHTVAVRVLQFLVALARDQVAPKKSGPTGRPLHLNMTGVYIELLWQLFQGYTDACCRNLTLQLLHALFPFINTSASDSTRATTERFFAELRHIVDSAPPPNSEPKRSDSEPRTSDYIPRLNDSKTRFSDSESRFSDNEPRPSDTEPRPSDTEPRPPDGGRATSESVQVYVSQEESKAEEQLALQEQIVLENDKIHVPDTNSEHTVISMDSNNHTPKTWTQLLGRDSDSSNKDSLGAVVSTESETKNKEDGRDILTHASDRVSPKNTQSMTQTSRQSSATSTQPPVPTKSEKKVNNNRLAKKESESEESETVVISSSVDWDQMLLLVAKQVIIDGAAVFFPDKAARRKQLFAMMNDMTGSDERLSVTLTFQSLCQFFSCVDPSGLLELPSSPDQSFEPSSLLCVMETLISVAHRELLFLLNTSGSPSSATANKSSSSSKASEHQYTSSACEDTCTSGEYTRTSGGYACTVSEQCEHLVRLLCSLQTSLLAWLTNQLDAVSSNGGSPGEESTTSDRSTTGEATERLNAGTEAPSHDAVTSRSLGSHVTGSEEQARRLQDLLLGYTRLLCSRCTQALECLSNLPTERIESLLSRLECSFLGTTCRHFVLTLTCMTSRLSSDTLVAVMTELYPLTRLLQALSRRLPSIFHSVDSGHWKQVESGLVSLRTWEVESNHSYENNQHTTQVFSCPGASNFIVTFDPHCETERRYDYLEFTDCRGVNTRYDQKVGTDKWPLTVTFSGGHKLHFLFHSDSSNNEWGYKFKVVAKGCPDVLLSWMYDLHLSLAKLYGRLCGATLDVSTVLPSALTGDRRDEAELELLRSELWTTLFRGGYSVTRLQRSLSGRFETETDECVRQFLFDVIQQEEELPKLFVQRCNEAVFPRGGGSILSQLGGPEVTRSVHAVLAALLWHTQPLRAEVQRWVNSEGQTRLKDGILQAFHTANSLRTVLLEEKQRQKAARQDGGCEVTFDPVVTCHEKAVFLLRFAGLTKVHLKHEHKGKFDRRSSKLYKLPSVTSADRVYRVDVALEKYPPFKLVLDFVRDPAWLVARVEQLLRMRADHARAASAVYTFAAEYLRHMAGENGNIFQVPIVSFLQELLSRQDRWARHYGNGLDGCGLELEGAVRSAFYMFVRRLVDSVASVKRTTLEKSLLPCYDYLQAVTLHVLDISWQPHDLAFLTDIQLPQLYMQLAKGSVTMREEVISPTDEEQELADYNRNMEWLKACKQEFIKWYEENSRKKDQSGAVQMFVARFCDLLEVEISCDGCGTTLPGRRYRCLQCADMDLCASCYAGGVKPGGDHSDDHEIVHLMFKCDECQAFIVGTRIHCDVCDDFDLCLGCQNAGTFPACHRAEHAVTRIPMVKLRLSANSGSSLLAYVHQHVWLSFAALSLSLAGVLHSAAAPHGGVAPCPHQAPSLPPSIGGDKLHTQANDGSQTTVRSNQSLATNISETVTYPETINNAETPNITGSPRVSDAINVTDENAANAVQSVSETAPSRSQLSSDEISIARQQNIRDSESATGAIPSTDIAIRDINRSDSLLPSSTDDQLKNKALPSMTDSTENLPCPTPPLGPEMDPSLAPCSTPYPGVRGVVLDAEHLRQTSVLHCACVSLLHSCLAQPAPSDEVEEECEEGDDSSAPERRQSEAFSVHAQERALGLLGAMTPNRGAKHTDIEDISLTFTAPRFLKQLFSIARGETTHDESTQHMAMALLGKLFNQAPLPCWLVDQALSQSLIENPGSSPEDTTSDDQSSTETEKDELEPTRTESEAKTTEHETESVDQSADKKKAENKDQSEINLENDSDQSKVEKETERFDQSEERKDQETIDQSEGKKELSVALHIDGLQTAKFLFRFGALCLERSGLEWAQTMAAILQSLLRAPAWRQVLERHLAACLASLSRKKQPRPAAIFALFVVAGFPEVLSLGCRVRFSDSGSELKHGVVLANFPDKSNALVVDSKTRKRRTLKLDAVEVVSQDGGQFLHSTHLQHFVAVVRDIVATLKQNEASEHVQRLWVLDLALKALLSYLSRGIAAVPPELYSAEFVQCVVYLGSKGTNFSRQLLLRDLEILALTQYTRESGTPTSSPTKLPPPVPSKTPRTPSSSTERPPAPDPEQGQAEESATEPVSEPTTPVCGEDPWEGLDDTARMCFKTLEEHMNISAAVLRALYELKDRSTNRLLMAVHELHNGEHLNLPEEVLEASLRWKSGGTGVASGAGVGSELGALDRQIDSGMQLPAPLLTVANPRPCVTEAVAEPFDDAPHLMLSSPTDAQRDTMRVRKTRSSLLLKREQEAQAKSATPGYLRKVNMAVAVLYARQVLGALLADWPDSGHVITAQLLGCQDNAMVPFVLDLLNRVETRDTFEKVVEKVTRYCSLDTLVPMATTSCQLLDELSVTSVTRQCQPRDSRQDTVTIPGASVLHVTFDHAYCTDDCEDTLVIASNKELTENRTVLSGGEGAWADLEIPGDTLYLKFTVENLGPESGYRMTVSGGGGVGGGRFDTGYAILNSVLQTQKTISDLNVPQLWTSLVHVACKQTGVHRLKAIRLLLKVMTSQFRSSGAPSLQLDLPLLVPLWRLYCAQREGSSEEGGSGLVAPVTRALTQLFITAEDLAMDWGVSGEYAASLLEPQHFTRCLFQGLVNIASVSTIIGVKNKATLSIQVLRDKVKIQEKLTPGQRNVSKQPDVAL